MVPLMMGQRGQCWFMLQYASQTLGSVEQSFSIFSGVEEELNHNDLWLFAKNFVAKAGSRLYAQQQE
jgi:hypothetical protein